MKELLNEILAQTAELKELIDTPYRPVVDEDEANTRNAEEANETFTDEVLPEDGNVY